MKMEIGNANLVQAKISCLCKGKFINFLCWVWVRIVIVCWFAIISGFGLRQNNFSGTWQVNVAKSDFVNLKPEDSAPHNLTILQAKDSIVIEKLFLHSNGGKNSYSETFKYNGRPTERIAPPLSRRLTTIRWSENKDTLYLNAHSFVNNKGLKWEYTTAEKWSLSIDGQMLIIQRTAILPDRNESYKAVYERQ